MKYKITLPKQINKILEMIEKSGEEAYLIGGCVRDAFLGISPQDFDITTSATPEQIKEIFRGENNNISDRSRVFRRPPPRFCVFYFITF